MTPPEAQHLYAAAMAAYHNPSTGFGTSPRHQHGNDAARGAWARTHAIALDAPALAEQAIRAAGLPFWAVWEAHHGVDPQTIPALAAQMAQEA